MGAITNSSSQSSQSGDKSSGYAICMNLVVQISLCRSYVWVPYVLTTSAQETWFGLITVIASLLELFGFGTIWESLNFKICLEVPNNSLVYSWIACQLDIGTSLGWRHNQVQFQIRGHFWIPQPRLHGAIILIFIVKSQNGLVTQFSRKGVFQRVFRHIIGDRCFSESNSYYKRKSVTFYTFFEKKSNI